MRRFKAQLDLLFGDSTDGVAALQDDCILYCNAAARAILGTRDCAEIRGLLPQTLPSDGVRVAVSIAGETYLCRASEPEPGFLLLRFTQTTAPAQSHGFDQIISSFRSELAPSGWPSTVWRETATVRPHRRKCSWLCFIKVTIDFCEVSMV